jgi:hypothetical protein
MIAGAVADVLSVLNADSPLLLRDIRGAVRARMSDAAGILCDAVTVPAALSEARKLNMAIRANGIAFGRSSEAARAVQWQQMARASEAVLMALHRYISDGGGSRGSRAILDPAGEGLPLVRKVRWRRCGSGASGPRIAKGRSFCASATAGSIWRSGPTGPWTRARGRSSSGTGRHGSAARRPGVLTKVGLQTFVDPVREGCAMNAKGAAAPIVSRVAFAGDTWLHFPNIVPDVCILRATTAVENGNLNNEHEGAYLGGLE